MPKFFRVQTPHRLAKLIFESDEKISREFIIEKDFREYQGDRENILDK
ncbi:MAG: hypothetical protein AB2L11_05265 [Syntrophobacteraceae bacterium]